MSEELKSTFETLEAWREGRKLRIEISQLVKDFPNEEKFRLTDQMIRASRAVTANIAEGYGRYHFQENIQFCRQARGSVYELLDHLYTCLDENYISEDRFFYFKGRVTMVIRIINGYIQYLIKKKQSNSPHSPHSPHSPKKNER